MEMKGKSLTEKINVIVKINRTKLGRFMPTISVNKNIF